MSQQPSPATDFSEPLLIVGLGNVGRRYARTRHNIGFLLLDFLQKHWYLPDFRVSLRHCGEISAGVVHGREVILLKPTTMMNLSGRSVSSLVNYRKINRENLLVVHDDVDIDFGRDKFAFDRGDAGHRGIRDINRQLGDRRYHRLRLGVHPDYPPGAPRPKASEYVLKKFSPEEEKLLPEIFARANEEIVRKFFRPSLAELRQ